MHGRRASQCREATFAFLSTFAGALDRVGKFTTTLESANLDISKALYREVVCFARQRNCSYLSSGVQTAFVVLVTQSALKVLIWKTG